MVRGSTQCDIAITERHYIPMVDNQIKGQHIRMQKIGAV